MADTASQADGKPSQQVTTALEAMSGNYTLKKLKETCSQLQSQLQDSKNEFILSLKNIENIKKEKCDLEETLEKERKRYNDLATEFAALGKLNRTAKEAELLLGEEAQIRFQLERDNDSLRHKIESLEMNLQETKRHIIQQNDIMSNDRKKMEEDRKVMEALRNELTGTKKFMKDREYDLDEVQVINIKLKRRNDELIQEVDFLRPELRKTAEQCATLAKENDAYHYELKTLRKEKKKLTLQVEDLQTEMEKRSTDYQSLQLQFYNLQNDYESLDKQKKLLILEKEQLIAQGLQLADQISKLNEVVQEKERDSANLLGKLTDTIREFESKLDAKDEQINLLSDKLEEETQRRAQTNMDVEYFTNMERKWQEKERKLVTDMEILKMNLIDKDKLVEELKTKVSQIQNSLYEPRMVRLQKLEREMKNGMDEFAVMEEALETGFLCIRCAKFLKKPVTLQPCGHTYCKACLDESIEENFNQLRCQECKSKSNGQEKPVASTFHNEVLENIIESFLHRKEKIKTFLKWMRQLDLKE